MTTETLTEAQAALKNYYASILALETTGVISRSVGDELSAEMMEWVGDYEEYNGTTYEGS